MRRSKRLGGLAALAVTSIAFAAGPASAQAEAATAATLTGTWAVTIETPQGTREMTWIVEQHEDGQLTGTVEGSRGPADIESGEVQDDAFAFMLVRSMGGQSFEVTFEGTFTDEELSGTMTAGGGQFTAEFTGVRAEGGSR